VPEPKRLLITIPPREIPYARPAVVFLQARVAEMLPAVDVRHLAVAVPTIRVNLNHCPLSWVVVV